MPIDSRTPQIHSIKQSKAAISFNDTWNLKLTWVSVEFLRLIFVLLNSSFMVIYL